MLRRYRSTLNWNGRMAEWSKAPTWNKLLKRIVPRIGGEESVGHRGFESRSFHIETTTENQVLNSDGEPLEGHHGEVAGNCAENLHPETNTYTEARGNAQ